jgi:hypothetical protein
LDCKTLEEEKRLEKVLGRGVPKEKEKPRAVWDPNGGIAPWLTLVRRLEQQKYRHQRPAGL